jgi:cytosine/adenosine deaminase-related metal-dependent hydrolase
MDPVIGALPRADVLAVDGEIAAIGPDLSVAGAEVLDVSGHVVLPGFVDSHRHVWQAPLRGIGADMSLGDYLNVVLGQIAPRYQPADMRLATLLGAAEALDAGVTTVFDWNNATLSPQHADAALDGFAAAGIRAVLGHGNPDDPADVRRLANRTGRVTTGLAIIGPEYMPFDLAARHIRLGRELGLVVSMHVGGGGPSTAVTRLHEADLLGPDLNLVHNNTISDDEVKMLVDSGVGITVTPTVEALMGHGSSAYGRFVDAGGAPAIGVDVVVNSVPDLFEPMRDALRAQRGRGANTPAAQLLRAVTIDGARAIGLADVVGSLAVGKRADIVVLGGLGHLTGTGDVAGAVVTSLGPADVRVVLVDGRVVKRDGHLVEHDLAALRAAAVEVARRVHPRS